MDVGLVGVGAWRVVVFVDGPGGDKQVSRCGRVDFGFAAGRGIRVLWCGRGRDIRVLGCGRVELGLAGVDSCVCASVWV